MGSKTTYFPPSDFSQAGGFFSFFTDLGQEVVAFAIWFLPMLGVIFFFWAVTMYIWKLRDGHAEDADRKKISWAIILLVVIFSVYGLIYLTRQIFGLQNTGVNQSIPFRRVN
jgi:hypothetical protein